MQFQQIFLRNYLLHLEQDVSFFVIINISNIMNIIQY